MGADATLQPAATQLGDEGPGMTASLVVDGTRAVDQTARALVPEATPPFRAALATDPRGLGGPRDGPTRRDAIDEEPAPAASDEH